MINEVRKKTNIGVTQTNMKLFEKVMELTVLLSVTVMFGGYALLVYPIEKLNEKLSSEVKQKQLKYAQQT